MTLATPGTTSVQFRLSNAYVRELDRLAEAHGVTRSDVLRVAVVASVSYQRVSFEARLDELAMYRGAMPAEEEGRA